TALVALGAIVIRALTHVFAAGFEFAPTPFVCRVSETLPTETVVCAETVVTPVVLDVNVMVQLPVPPAVVHGFAVVSVPGPLSIGKLICVPIDSGPGTLTTANPCTTAGGTRADEQTAERQSRVHARG